MRYRLHLTDKQLEILRYVFESYDWLCNCEDFPYCEDFRIFQNLKKRISNLDVKSIQMRDAGSRGLQVRDEILIRNIISNITR